MNCMDFRKYAGAFADGELEVAQNLEALEHLNMCPRCAERVTEITNLKTALKRTCDVGPAPRRLRDRVLAALDSPVESTAQPASNTARRWATFFRWGTSLGLAAAITLAVYMAWFPQAAELPIGILTVMANQPILDVGAQHQACALLGPKHHDASLPRDLSDISRRLGEELNLTVLAPNLEAQGFDLLGADKCGIRGRPGAHLLYHSATTGELLSIFTVGRWAQLDAGLSIDESVRLSEGEVLASAGDEIQVVAWHEGSCTHALCGPFSGERLVGLVTRMRIASSSIRPTADSASPVLAYAP